MDPIGDVCDGDVDLWKVGPDFFPHLPGYVTVKPADTVGMGGEFEGQDHHAEALGWIGRMLSTQGHQLFEGDAQQTTVPCEIFLHHGAGKHVISRRNRRMGRENVIAAHGFPGCVKRKAVFLHEQADAFQGCEGRVSFVHVVDGGIEFQGFDGPGSANSQEDLLPDARFGVATIELVGDAPVFGRVFRHVGVQKEERDPADLNLPDPCLNGASCHVHRDAELMSVLSLHTADGHVVEGIFFIPLLLPAVIVKILLKIAHLIEEADAEERKIEVAG